MSANATPRVHLEGFLRDPSEESFRLVHEATRDRVWTICHRLLAPPAEDAEEAFQRAYIRLVGMARAGQAPPFPGDADATMARLAFLEADALRKRRSRRARRETASLEFHPQPHDSSPDPRDQAADRERRARLEEIVSMLPETDRLAVQLHYFHGLTHREIAETLGESRTTVTSRIQRSLDRLRPALKRAGLADTEAVLAIAGAGLLVATTRWSHADIWQAAINAPAPPMVPASVAGFLARPAVSVYTAIGAAMLVVVGATALLLMRPSADEKAGESATVQEIAAPAPAAMIANTDSGDSSSGSRDIAKHDATAEATSVVVSPPPDPQSSTAPGRFLRGRVTIPGGRPAVGATVVLLSYDKSNDPLSSAGLHLARRSHTETGRSVANEGGKYQIEIPGDGSHVVQASLEGFATTGKRFELVEEENGKVIDLAMEHEAVVSGRVVNGAGSPLVGVLVSAWMLSESSWARPSVQTTTDAGGGFSLRGIAAGVVGLRASTDDGRATWLKARAPADGIKLVLEGGTGSLSGRVYHAHTGGAMGGLPIVAACRAERDDSHEILLFRAVTSDTGSYAFPALPASYIQLAVDSPRWRIADGNDLWLESLTLQPGENRTDLDLRVYEGHTVRGVVLDRETGEPVEGAFVTCEDGDDQDSDYTDAGGRFLLQNVFGTIGYVILAGETGGRSTALSPVYASKEGYYPSRVQSNSMPTAKEPGADSVIRLYREVFIEGHVVDSTGRPVEDALISMATYASSIQPQSGVRSRPDGSFRFPCPKGGSFKLGVSADGYPKYTSDLLEPEGDMRDMRIVLEKGMTLRGRVVHTNGSPVDGAEIRLQSITEFTVPANREEGTYAPLSTYSSYSDIGKTNTNSDGVFVIENLPSFEQLRKDDADADNVMFIFDVAKEGYYSHFDQEGESLIASGGEPTIVLVMESEGRNLSGRIVNADGDPVAGVSVRTEPVQGVVRETRSGMDGTFRLRGIPGDSATIILELGDKTWRHEDQQTSREDCVYTIDGGSE